MVARLSSAASRCIPALVATIVLSACSRENGEGVGSVADGASSLQCGENAQSAAQPSDSSATGATIEDALDVFAAGHALLFEQPDVESSRADVVTRSDRYTLVLMRRSDDSVFMRVEMSRARDVWKVDRFSSC